MGFHQSDKYELRIIMVFICYDTKNGKNLTRSEIFFSYQKRKVKERKEDFVCSWLNLAMASSVTAILGIP